MAVHKKSALVAIALVLMAIGPAGASLAGEPQQHVVGDQDIQARIDLQLGKADADRQAIRTLLQRKEVQQLAGSAGLDLERANAAAAVLSGPSLERLAAQARTLNADLTGGDSTIVISASAAIIILLLLIILLR